MPARSRPPSAPGRRGSAPPPGRSTTKNADQDSKCRQIVAATALLRSGAQRATIPAPASAPRAPRVLFGGTVAKEIVLTREGYEKLKQEIEHLSTEKRR